MDPKILTFLGYASLGILAFAITFIYLSFKYSLFSSIKVQEISFGSGNLLFIPYQGDYSKISNHLNSIMKELSATFGSNTKYFGIYYDDPESLEDRNMARAIVGGLFDEKVDLKPFILAHPEFKMTTFSNLKGFGAKMPLYSSLNVLSAIIRAYPIIKSYGIKNNLMSKVLCAFEIYDYPNCTMTISFPYHQGNESILFQSGYPIPKSKVECLKKNE